MARVSFMLSDDFALKISRLETRAEDIAKKAIYAGAKIVADKVAANLDALPTDKYRRLKSDEKLNVLSAEQKEDLKEGFGITPIKLDKDGNWSAKVGFDGYGRYPTKKYPKGLPNQLLARSIESGSSVRHKKPFVRPALNAVKNQVQEEMSRVAEEEIKKILADALGG